MYRQLTEFKASQPTVLEHLAQSLVGRRRHHAFLFLGSRATPLQELGMAFANRLMCQQPQALDACGQCLACRKMAHHNHPDFLSLEPNERGIVPVADIRRVTMRAQLRAIEAEYKVILIQGACQMPVASQNALLKTLEEPPDKTTFVLLASRGGALLATVRSRCQKIHLQATPHDDAVTVLSEQGIPNFLGAFLAPLVGSDAAQAQEKIDAGALDILETIKTTLTEGVAIADVFSAAARLGTSRERFDLTLALLEVLIRDALAQLHGAMPTQLYHSTVYSLPQKQLMLVVEELQRLRQLDVLHLNRTMALENLFLTLLDMRPSKTIVNA